MSRALGCSGVFVGRSIMLCLIFFSMSALKCSRHRQLRILINCNCKCVFELFRFHSKFCGNSYDLVFDNRNSYNVPFYILYIRPKKPITLIRTTVSPDTHIHTHTQRSVGKITVGDFRWRRRTNLIYFPSTSFFLSHFSFFFLFFYFRLALEQ